MSRSLLQMVLSTEQETKEVCSNGKEMNECVHATVLYSSQVNTTCSSAMLVKVVNFFLGSLKPFHFLSSVNDCFGSFFFHRKRMFCSTNDRDRWWNTALLEHTTIWQTRKEMKVRAKALTYIQFKKCSNVSVVHTYADDVSTSTTR